MDPKTGLTLLQIQDAEVNSAGKRNPASSGWILWDVKGRGGRQLSSFTTKTNPIFVSEIMDDTIHVKSLAQYPLHQQCSAIFGRWNSGGDAQPCFYNRPGTGTRPQPGDWGQQHYIVIIVTDNIYWTLNSSESSVASQWAALKNFWTKYRSCKEFWFSVFGAFNREHYILYVLSTTIIRAPSLRN